MSTGNALSIREAGTNDLPEVVGIVQGVLGEFELPVCASELSAELGEVVALNGHDHGRLWVAVDGDAVVGCAAITPVREGVCELKRMYLLPAYRGSGVGRRLLGLYEFPQVEGWIPIFLFAMLFGLSMDYEVFLVTRMRESWDAIGDNSRAVAVGLERTGRIITAAAVVMVAAFSGFLAGRIVGLQEFGLGLAVAIFVDATIVRALLVPALMAIMGRYNWWLPARVARAVRVAPSPLQAR